MAAMAMRAGENGGFFALSDRRGDNLSLKPYFFA